MTAVVASRFMGSIPGSSVANTVTTGVFTIPLVYYYLLQLFLY